MNKEIKLKTGLILIEREDNVKVLMFENFTTHEYIDFLSKYSTNIVTIVGSFNERNFNQILNVESLIVMDADFTNIEPSYFYNLLNLKRLNLVDSEISREFKFANIKTLEELELNWDKSYGFSNCINLRELVLRKMHINSLEFLINLPKIENLEMIQGKIKNLDGLENLSSLKAVTIYKIKVLENIDNLSKLPNLEYLHLNGFKHEIDIEKLTINENIKWLVFENCSNIINPYAAAKLKNLNGILLLGKTNLTKEERDYLTGYDKTTYIYNLPNDVRYRNIENAKNL